MDPFLWKYCYSYSPKPSQMITHWNQNCQDFLVYKALGLPSLPPLSALALIIPWYFYTSHRNTCSRYHWFSTIAFCLKNLHSYSYIYIYIAQTWILCCINNRKSMVIRLKLFMFFVGLPILHWTNINYQATNYDWPGMIQ